VNLNRRIFVSAPRTERLIPTTAGALEPRRRLKDAIVEKVRAAGYKPQMFLTPSGGEGLAPNGWSVNQAEALIRRCAGAVLIGLPFFESTLDGRRLWLPTDYCQYEGAIARTMRLPTLAISIGIERRILFHDHAPVTSLSGPLEDDVSWLDREPATSLFDTWSRRVQARSDVFLGYSSASEAIAMQIKALVENAGASVRDWRSDFVAGSTILSSITEAAETCSCGIFVFGEDDSLATGDHVMAPRDNVVFEAGFFMHARGHKSCLIIRSGASKMPADVGGIIYLPLPTAADVAAIAPGLSTFLAENLVRNSPDE
jgi:hypothetical protein